MCPHDVTVKWYVQWNCSNMYWIFNETSAFAFIDRNMGCHFFLDILSPGRFGRLWFHLVLGGLSYMLSVEFNFVLYETCNLFSEGLVYLFDTLKNDSSYQNCYLTSNIHFCKTSNIFRYDDCLSQRIWNIFWRWQCRSVCNAIHFIAIIFFSTPNEFKSNGVTHVINPTLVYCERLTTCLRLLAVVYSLN